jgi:hypothetical protein
LFADLLRLLFYLLLLLFFSLRLQLQNKLSLQIMKDLHQLRLLLFRLLNIGVMIRFSNIPDQGLGYLPTGVRDPIDVYITPSSSKKYSPLLERIFGFCVLQK